MVYVKGVWPMLSSKSFIVSGLILGPESTLSLFLCVVLGGVLISFFFFFFYVWHSSFLAPLIEGAVFSPLYILASFFID